MRTIRNRLRHNVHVIKISLASNMDKNKYYWLLVLVSSYLTVSAPLTYQRSRLLSASYKKTSSNFPLEIYSAVIFMNVATQRCSRKNNWNTIGSLFSVLSYLKKVTSFFLNQQQIGTKLFHNVLNPAHVSL